LPQFDPGFAFADRAQEPFCSARIVAHFHHLLCDLVVHYLLSESARPGGFQAERFVFVLYQWMYQSCVLPQFDPGFVFADRA